MVLVALTGYGTLRDREHSIEAGFDHHLVKPVDLDELRRLLDQRGAATRGGASDPLTPPTSGSSASSRS
jgi:CheY-like chemotaxis protein